MVVFVVKILIQYLRFPKNVQSLIEICCCNGEIILDIDVMLTVLVFITTKEIYMLVFKLIKRNETNSLEDCHKLQVLCSF